MVSKELRNIRKNNFKYVIFSPEQVTGGAIVLHKLCQELIQKGIDARMFYCWPFVDWEKKHNERNFNSVLLFWATWLKCSISSIVKKMLAHIIPERLLTDFFKRWLNGYYYVQVKGTRRKWFPYVDNKTIVVYPDIVYGNPLHSKKVVRWLLYYNRYKEKYSENNNDLFICHRSIYNDPDLNPEEKTVYFTDYDSSIYNDPKESVRRTGNCYIIRKGRNRADLPDKFDGPIVDNLTEKQKSEVFKSSKYCISYDTQTFYSKLAVVCGCISIVVPEMGKRRDDYVGIEDHTKGISYGFDNDEIQKAISERESVLQSIKDEINDNKRNALKFLNYCNEWFKA